MTRAELEQDCDFLGLIIMQVQPQITSHKESSDYGDDHHYGNYVESYAEPAEKGNIWGDSRASPGEIPDLIFPPQWDG